MSTSDNLYGSKVSVTQRSTMYAYTHAHSLQWSPTDLSQHCCLTTEVGQTETQEVVDDEGLITAAYGVKIDGVIGPDETDPRAEAIDGDNEEDSNNPQLLVGDSVVSQVLEYLYDRREETRKLRNTRTILHVCTKDNIMCI